MKKKVITALLITMTLTLSSVGTVFAMNNNVTVTSGEEVNEVKEGFVWVVDKEAVYKTVHHEAEYKTVHHEAEYETVHHEAEGYYEKQQVQVGTKPIYEKEKHVICYSCGGIDIGIAFDPINGGMSQTYAQHRIEHNMKGETAQTEYVDVDVQVGEEPIYEEKEVWIETKPAWDEQILIREAYDEEILVKEAWDETILVSPEEGHWEPVKDEETKPENPDEETPENREAYDEEILVKEAWDETILVSPEEGHWEPVKDEETKPENPDEETPENPEQKPDEETPENPEQTPDEETPENPEQTPDEEKPENPDQKPDEEKPETPDQKPEEQKKPEQESGKENTTTVPKTGDPTNLAYLATLAGSALVGGASLKFRKRK